MANAIARSNARKVIIPVNTCGIYVAGMKNDITLAELIDDVVEEIEASIQ